MEPNNTLPSLQTNNSEQHTLSIKKSILIKIGISLSVLILIFIILFVYQHGKMNSKDEKITALTSKARTAYLSGKFKSAEDSYKAALALDKKNPVILTGLIDATASQGNQTGQEKQALQSATPYIQQLTQSQTSDPNALVAIGYINETAGNYQTALQYYNQVLSNNPQNSQAWFHKGHDLEFLDQQTAAFQAYDKSYALNPKDPSTLLAKGRESARQGNNIDSEMYLNTITSLPNVSPQVNSEALTDLATIQASNLLKMDKAIALAKSAVEADPTYAPAAAEYGYLLTINGHPVEGIANLKKGLELNPNITRTSYMMAIALRSGGYNQDAANFLIYGLKIIDYDNTLLNSNDRTAFKANISYELGKTESLLGNQTLSIQYVKDALHIQPNLKTKLQQDVQKNLFRNMMTNKEFILITT